MTDCKGKKKETSVQLHEVVNITDILTGCSAVCSAVCIELKNKLIPR